MDVIFIMSPENQLKKSAGGWGTAFFYEWGSGLFSFTVPIIKCKSAKDWHCKNFVHEFCKFFAFFLQNRGHTINIRGKVRA